MPDREGEEEVEETEEDRSLEDIEEETGIGMIIEGKGTERIIGTGMETIRGIDPEMIKETGKEKKVEEKGNWREMVIGDTVEGGRIRVAGIEHILTFTVVLKFTST